jgi:L-ascorbate metabolism protein UlaG (beta-lactamase superfamily)
LRIRWRGHASFYIESHDVKIITDPFPESLGYPLVWNQADIVTLSHNHWDHAAVDTVAGEPAVVKGTGEFKTGRVLIQGFASYHDKKKGRERGENTIYKIAVDDLNIVHLGDLGHVLPSSQVKQYGSVDILLVPVGGKFTIDAAEAFAVVQSIKPKIAIPMHYQTPHLSFQLGPVEEFTSRFERVVKVPFLDSDRQKLPQEPKIMVLDYLSY